MKKTKRRALYIIAALLAALFVLSCIVGFAACGGGEEPEPEPEPTPTEATVSSVSISGSKSEMTVGDEVALAASVTMSDSSAYKGSYSWSTSDSSVVSLSATNTASVTATAKAKGDATITLAVDDSKTATCKITVAEEEPSVTLLATLSGTAKIDSGMGFNLDGDVTMMLYSDGNVSLSVDIYGTVTPYSATYTIDDSGNITLTIGSYTPDTGTVVYDTDGSILAIELTSFTGVTQNVTFAVEGYTPETGGDENPGGGDIEPGDEPEPEATQVSTAEELAAAVALGGEIVLTDDIELSDTLEIETDVALDLAGQTVSAGDSGENTIEVTDGTLTISDSSEDGAIANTYTTHVSNDNAAAIEVNGGDLIIESGTIESTSVGVRALNGSVTVDGGTIESSGYYALWESEGEVDVVINDGIVGGSYAGILVDGDSNFGYADSALQVGAVTTLTVNGGIVYSGGDGQAAIRTESMTSKDSAIITINGGLVYGAQAAPGIFLGNGTLKITDGIIAGSTAAEVQAGDVTISGGVFYATDDEQKITYTTANSASFTNGYALSIIPRGYVWRVASDQTFSMALTVTVTAGTFYGEIYVAETSVIADTDGSTWELGSDNYAVDPELYPLDCGDYYILVTAHDVEGTYADGEWTYVCVVCGETIDKDDVADGTVYVHHSNNIASTTDALFSAIEESNFWNQYLV